MAQPKLKIRTPYNVQVEKEAGVSYSEHRPLREYKNDELGERLEYITDEQSGEILTENVYQTVQDELENVITPKQAVQFEAATGKLHPAVKKGVFGNYTDAPEHSADLVRETKKAAAILSAGFIDSNGNVKEEYIISDENIENAISNQKPEIKKDIKNEKPKEVKDEK